LAPQALASPLPSPNLSTSTLSYPYPKPFPTATSKVVRTMSLRDWESTFCGMVKNPPGKSILVANVNCLNQDPWWGNNTPGHWGNMRDLRDLIMREKSRGSDYHSH
jgi:hypothetical protein